jgi:hypothetical protein
MVVANIPDRTINNTAETAGVKMSEGLLLFMFIN